MQKEIAHAIFDIGKTNKKLFLFDTNGHILWSTSINFPTVEDEDGFTSDNLNAIETWMKETIEMLMKRDRWVIETVNFSAYGASLVYLDENGERLPMFIDYLKPYPDEISERFFNQYGPKEKFCRETASPYLGMLNSGLQIYWLKYAKAKWFSRVRYVLHFPQYLSYIFTGKVLAEYTSIGCHTGMWDYEKKDYHEWIDREGIRDLLPSLTPSNTWSETRIPASDFQVGTGLHDTSASLIPYLAKESTPFLLLSTGTWAVCVNPFSRDVLSEDDLEKDCLNFLRIDGQQVRAARLFLGREHEIQVEALSRHYATSPDEYMKLNWDPAIFEKAIESVPFPFEFEHLPIESPTIPEETDFPDRIHAYYQLMNLLIPLQLKAIHRAAGSQHIPRLIIEGGFTNNQIFVHLLQRSLPDWEVTTSDMEGGSARGVWELIP